MEIVFDSSTLILLAKVEILRNCSEHFRIMIPQMVEEESIVKDTFDSKLIASLIAEGHIDVVKTVSEDTVKMLRKDFRIHAGEAAALALAIHKNIALAVDDLPTIKACKIINRPFTTAMHLLLKMAASGRIDRETALVKLEKLSFYGRYKKRIIDDAYSRLQGGV